jgi:hypothetical protein
MTHPEAQGGIMAKLLFVLICLFAVAAMVSRLSCYQQAGEADAERRILPAANLEVVLRPFFEDVQSVRWVIFDGHKAYVGFEANYNPASPGPLETIMANAGRLAHRRGCGRVELWAVDALRAGPGWTPETGIEAWMLTTVTPGGQIIHTQ